MWEMEDGLIAGRQDGERRVSEKKKKGERITGSGYESESRRVRTRTGSEGGRRVGRERRDIFIAAAAERGDKLGLQSDGREENTKTKVNVCSRAARAHYSALPLNGPLNAPAIIASCEFSDGTLFCIDRPSSFPNISPALA